MLKIRIIGDQVLRESAEEVTEFDEKLKRLTEEMIEIELLIQKDHRECRAGNRNQIDENG